MQHKYRVNIVRSDEDNCYLVELPEFSNALQRYFTHGDTYAEAIANAEEVLELLIEDYEETGKTLPSPQVLQLI
jgi:predicted RNase H-like HicB family nuclease